MFWRDPVGQLIPMARVHKRARRWEMWEDSALPSWLTTASGTTTFFPMSGSSRGVARATSGAVSGDTAEIQLASALDVANVNAMMWTVEGLSFGSTTTFDFEIAMLGAAGVGCAFRQLTAEATSTLFGEGTTSGSAAGAYSMRAAGRKNLTLALSVTSRHLAIMAGDQDIHYRTLSAVTGGLVTPSLKLTTRSASARYFEFAAVDLQVFHN